MEMDYAEAKLWLDSLGQRMEGYDLSNIRKLCEISDVGVAGLKAVHVAGSNGKGSTCAFIERIMREAGCKTGLYTSPHLVEPTERMQIDGEKIRENRFAELAGIFKKVIEENKIAASCFEAITAMAFRHFIDEGVDILVAETGMGGRLDATNILNPQVCAITSVSLEHTQYLGKTIEKIAAEKAGIIKEGTTAVFSGENRGAEIFEKAAVEKGAKIVKPEYNAIAVAPWGNEFDLLSPSKIPGLKTNILGAHQCENAALGAAAAISLREYGFTVAEKHIKAGLRNVSWRGRLEIVKKKPLVVFDAAHNPDGWEKLFESLKLFGKKRLLVVFGTMKDKDVGGVKKLLEQSGAELFLADAGSERSESAEMLGKKIGMGKIFGSVDDAIDSAFELAGSDGLVLVTGSLHVLGQGYRHFGIEV